MERIKLAVAGLGSRGFGLLKNAILPSGQADICAICDPDSEKRERAAALVSEHSTDRPALFSDCREMTVRPDALLVATDWTSHAGIAVWCMETGIASLIEVGGAASVGECERLVETYRRTGTPLMFAENCCFGKDETLAASMAAAGIFGDIVHCSGAYAHDLREYLLGKPARDSFRLEYARRHNCDYYPTHELGPIAKILGINRGNRMLSLVSVASRPAGLADYARRSGDPEAIRLTGNIIQGDIVNTVITCENGETVSLRLDTSLPRFYSRELTVRGTRGMFEAATGLVFLDGDEPGKDTPDSYRKYSGTAERYYDRFLPGEWKTADTGSGHGGMDGLMVREFFRSLRDGDEMPVDVYDMAAWSAVSCLSEESVARGGAPVAVPDFTNGEYRTRKPRSALRS